MIRSYSENRIENAFRIDQQNGCYDLGQPKRMVIAQRKWSNLAQDNGQMLLQAHIGLNTYLMRHEYNATDYTGVKKLIIGYKYIMRMLF